ncbi:hypothetical protein DL95DRAFT_461119 [Leptodontidium sp. 2 PMI_412]|nr:hypothetical protein DL95DRAFT_461119 [Leptodontidium sp. 2 PMI_412]
MPANPDAEDLLDENVVFSRTVDLEIDPFTTTGDKGILQPFSGIKVNDWRTNGEVIAVSQREYQRRPTNLLRFRFWFSWGFGTSERLTSADIGISFLMDVAGEAKRPIVLEFGPRTIKPTVTTAQVSKISRYNLYASLPADWFRKSASWFRGRFGYADRAKL